MVNMASELVNSATSDKLTEMDWMKNIEICELVAHDHRQAKDVIKAVKKCLRSKHSNTQLYAVLLLEMLMNNIGEPVHKQVTETGILPILVKIVKKKSDLPVREKIFLLLDAAQTSVGGASGRFPQYYSAYYELVSAGVQFAQRPRDIPKPHATSNSNENNSLDKVSATKCESAPNTQPQKVSEYSILEKASTALEVLKDVLNAVDAQHPEGAEEEFTLDLVEQCSFQKQRIMQLAMTSRDEKIISRAIELNEQLERVLRRHDALVSGRTMSISSHIDHERKMTISSHIDQEQAAEKEKEDEEEEAEQLSRRIRKGKACLRPEDEGCQIERPLGFLGCPVPGEMLHRPLIRPLTVEPKQQLVRPLIMEPKQEFVRPLTDQEANGTRPAVAIPPPPAKHVEREVLQGEKADVSSLDGHVRNLSLHRRNASSSRSGSLDYSD